MQPGFSFLNLDPKPELLAYKQKILGYLWEMSPSDSRLDGHLEASADGYRATLCLASSEFRCTVDEKWPTPMEAMEKAATAILTRLNEWCTERYKKLMK